ncbi:MAG: hypothetical protein JWM16_2041 [Verrucomicrobiales bacterium]|nr:hypothetical protein [Verrucomicrobiales bacterium]
MCRHHGSRILAALLCITAVFQNGCTSARSGDGTGDSAIRQFFLGTRDIPYWVDSFWDRKGRLPADYPELAAFVSQRTNGNLQLENHPRVDFTLLPSGQRHADFYSVESGKTNISSRLTWGKPKGL